MHVTRKYSAKPQRMCTYFNRNVGPVTFQVTPFLKFYQSTLEIGKTNRFSLFLSMMKLDF